MPDNYIWILFSKSLSGEASSEEKLKLQELLSNDDVLCRKYDVLQQFWGSSQSGLETGLDENSNIKKIIERAETATEVNTTVASAVKKRYKKRFTAGLVLSAVLVLVTLLVNIRKLPLNTTEKAQPKNIYVAKGVRNKVALPDGSLVYLNSGSELKFNNFNDKKREVTLIGEGFFEVKKQPDREPFIVHVNGINIKVLGTTFDVKAYAEDKTVEAVLLKGLIEVSDPKNQNAKPFYLHPNERLVMQVNSVQNNNIPAPISTIKKEQPLSKTATIYQMDSNIEAQDRIETAWIYNRLEFRNLSFIELVPKMERWYNIKITLQDEDVKKLSFNGSFEEETPEQAFAALQTAVPFDYTINNNEVFVRTSKKAAP